MALNEGLGALEDRICRFLVQRYPNFVSLESIATEVQEAANRVSRELHRKLIPKRLCEKASDMEGHVFRATESLRARCEDTASRSSVTQDEEDRAEERAKELFVRHQSVLPPAGPESVAPKRPSILPVTPASRRSPSRQSSAVPQPQYVPTQPWGNIPIYPYPPPPGLVYPPSAVPPQAWYPQQAPVQRPVAHVAAPAQWRPSPSKKSILKIKPSSRTQPRQKTPTPPEEMELSASKLDTGHYDISVFPEGLWNHVPYEGRRVRQQMAVETRTRHPSTQGLIREDRQSGLLGNVRVRPEGRGRHALAKEPLDSAASDGPLPPGLTLTPQDIASTELSRAAVQRPVSRYTQESSGRGTAEGASTSSPEYGAYME